VQFQLHKGFQAMNAAGSEVLRHVDIGEDDRIVAVDGEPVTELEYTWDLERVLARGRLSLTLEREGRRLEREFVLRGR